MLKRPSMDWAYGTIISSNKCMQSLCKRLPHLHLVPRWRISGPVPPFPLFALMAFIGQTHQPYCRMLKRLIVYWISSCTAVITRSKAMTFVHRELADEWQIVTKMRRKVAQFCHRFHRSWLERYLPSLTQVRLGTFISRRFQICLHFAFLCNGIAFSGCRLTFPSLMTVFSKLSSREECLKYFAYLDEHPPG